jgi:hypothetical protein
VIPHQRLQQIITSKDQEAASAACNQYRYVESWAIIDGALIIYDCDAPPAWLAPVLEARDDDGNTTLA